MTSEVVSLMAALSLGTLSFLMYIGLPIIMGAVADQHGFDEQELGWIASADLAGLFCGSIVTSLLLSKWGVPKIAAFGIAVAVFGNSASVAAETLVSMSSARFLADLGGGMCHALALACLARLSNPSRNFSLFMVVIVTVGSAWLFALPEVAARWTDNGIFIILTIAYVVPAASLRYIGSVEPTGQGAQNISASQTKALGGNESLPILAGSLALVGVLFFNAGATSFWAFAERVGISINLEPSVISLTFTVCNILTLAGCWLAYALCSARGPFRPNFAVLLVAILVFLLSTLNLFVWSYVALIFFFFQAWAMTGIFQWAILGDIDSTGRLVALAPAAQGLGMSVGPVVSGSLLGVGLSMSSVAGVNAAFMVLTLVAFYFLYVLDKNRRENHVPL